MSESCYRYQHIFNPVFLFQLGETLHVFWILCGEEVIIYSPEEGPNGEFRIEYFSCPEETFFYSGLFDDGR